MTTTPNMGMVLPDDHGSIDLWGGLLNTIFSDRLDLHDHTTGKGVKVPSAGLNINADVAWASGGTPYAITGAKAFDMAPVAAATVAALAGALFVNSADNNLYYRTTAGVNIQVTNGATLNVSIVGGIGGDYTAVGALVDYDDATDTYRFRQETAAAVRQFAKLSAATVQIFEYKAAGNAVVPGNAVRLKSPAALAAAYDIELLAALPGAQAFLQISTAGVLTASNTIAQNVTVLELKHTGALAESYGAGDWYDPNGTHTKQLSTVGALKDWLLAASANKLFIPIKLPIGSRITGYSVYLSKNTSNVNTVTARLYRMSAATGTIGTETALGAGNSSNANAPGAIQLTESGLTIDMAVGNFYYLVFTPGGGVAPAADQLYSAEVTYTRP